jgi:hypothetical protein
MNDTLSASPGRRAAACCLLLAAVCGIALRLASLSDPLWLDELHTAWTVSATPGDVAWRARMGNQSPLWFRVNYALFYTFGQNEFALRLPSLLAALALLPSIAWLVYRRTGSALGSCLAMWLAAVDDRFLFYAVEARPYAMVQLAAVWQVAFFLELLFPRNNKSSSGKELRFDMVAGWVLTTVLLFYLHFTTLLLVVTELAIAAPAVWLAPRAASASRRRVWPVCGAAILTAALCLPGLLELLAMGRYRHVWQSATSADRYGLLVIAQFSVYLLPAVVTGWLFRRPRNPVDRNRDLIVLVLLAAVPMAVCWLGSATGQWPLGHYRYTVASSTLLIMAAGLAVAMLPARRLQLIGTLVTMILAVVTNPLLAVWLQGDVWPAQRHENWSEVLETIKISDRAVVFCPNLVEDAVAAERGRSLRWQEYYAFALRTSLYPVIDDDGKAATIISVPIVRQQAGLSAEQIIELTRCGARFWLLVRAWPEDAKRVAERLEESLRETHVVNDVQVRQVNDAPLNLFEFAVTGDVPADAN